MHEIYLKLNSVVYIYIYFTLIFHTVLFIQDVSLTQLFYAYVGFVDFWISIK